MQSDSDIQHAVLQELEWDTRIEHTDIGVTVRSGIVTLVGSVDSWAKRLAAQQAAHRVSGVLDVANDIHVMSAGVGSRTDADVARAVRQALEWNVFVPADRIRSTVSDGRVTLQGEVDSLTQRDDAESAIEHLAGVQVLENEIAVKAPTVLGAGDVQHAIHAAFERRSARESDRLKVEIAGGTVTLSGAVHSWAERKAAIGAARGTPGVCHVEDQLRIEP
jgi:osmotically-inducible protein OsmY